MCMPMAGLKEILASVIRWLLGSGDGDHGDGDAVLAGSLTLKDKNDEAPKSDSGAYMLSRIWSVCAEFEQFCGIQLQANVELLCRKFHLTQQEPGSMWSCVWSVFCRILNILQNLVAGQIPRFVADSSVWRSGRVHVVQQIDHFLQDLNNFTKPSCKEISSWIFAEWSIQSSMSAHVVPCFDQFLQNLHIFVETSCKAVSSSLQKVRGSPVFKGDFPMVQLRTHHFVQGIRGFDLKLLVAIA